MFEIKFLEIDDTKKRLDFLENPEGEEVLGLDLGDSIINTVETFKEAVVQLPKKYYEEEYDLEAMLEITLAALKIKTKLEILGGAIHYKAAKDSLHIHLPFVEMVEDEKIIVNTIKEVWE